MEIIINNEKLTIREANTFIKKFFGLMGKKNIQEGLLFKKTRAIHTFFMREPIDIIMLNKNKEIIYIKKNLQPNRVLIKKKAYYTIELPFNTLKNDLVNIEFPT